MASQFKRFSWILFQKFCRFVTLSLSLSSSLSLPFLLFRMFFAFLFHPISSRFDSRRKANRIKQKIHVCFGSFTHRKKMNENKNDQNDERHRFVYFVWMRFYVLMCKQTVVFNWIQKKSIRFCFLTARCGAFLVTSELLLILGISSGDKSRITFKLQIEGHWSKHQTLCQRLHGFVCAGGSK